MKALRTFFVLAMGVILVGSAFAQDSGQTAPPQRGNGQNGRQQGGGRMGMMQNNVMEGSGFQLLNRADVRADLKLTEEQIGKLDKLQQDYMSVMRERLMAARQNGENPQEIAAQLDKEVASEIKKVLTDEQESRFFEIRVQIAGIRAVQSADVQKALNLDPAVRTKINNAFRDAKNANQAMMDEMRAARQNGGQGMSREDMQAKMEAANKSLDEKLKSLLTETDLENLKKLGGAPFKATAGANGQGNGTGTGRPGGGRPGSGGTQPN